VLEHTALVVTKPSTQPTSGDHDGTDTGIGRSADGGPNLCAFRIDGCHQTGQGKVGLDVVRSGVVAVGQGLVCHGEHTEGLLRQLIDDCASHITTVSVETS